MVLPVFVTFCDAQNRSNNCNSYANAFHCIHFVFLDLEKTSSLQKWSVLDAVSLGCLTEYCYSFVTLHIRAVNWDSQVFGLAGPGWTRESESTSKDSWDSPEHCLGLPEHCLMSTFQWFWTRESSGTRESTGGESTSPKNWTPSSSTTHIWSTFSDVLQSAIQYLSHVIALCGKHRSILSGPWPVFCLILVAYVDLGVTSRLSKSYSVHSNKIRAKEQGKCCPFLIWEMPCRFAMKNPIHCLWGNCHCLFGEIFASSTEVLSATSTCTWACPFNRDFSVTHRGIPCCCSPRIHLFVLAEVLLWN